MKKALLSISLLCSAFFSAEAGVRADAFLQSYTTQKNSILVDEVIGETILNILKDADILEEFVRLCKLKLSTKDLERLREIVDLLIEIEELNKDPQLINQSKVFAELYQSITEENASEVSKKIETECFLITKQLNLIEKLRGFYSGVGKGMQGIDFVGILEDIKQNLE